MEVAQAPVESPVASAQPTASSAPWAACHCRSAQSSCSASPWSERCSRSATPSALVALSQSNSRGDQLLRLQRQAVGLQIVLTDATQLKRTIESRINAPGGPGFTKGFGSGLDQTIGTDMGQLCVDSGLKCFFGEPNFGSFHLAEVDPKAFELLSTSVPLFYPIINADVGGVSDRPIDPSAHRQIRDLLRGAGRAPMHARPAPARTRSSPPTGARSRARAIS